MSGCHWVDFRAVKAAVSMATVLSAYRVEGLKRSGKGQLRGRCPIHRGGAQDAFHVSLSKNAFQCFYCHAAGNIFDLVAALEGCSVRQAALQLQAGFGIGHVSGQSTGAPAERQLVPEKTKRNQPLGFQLAGVDREHPYLAQRGISSATARAFGVGFYAGRGVMQGRLVIPIQDELGRIVAYSGRSLDGSEPRYKLPAGFHKSLVVFNLHRAVGCGEQTVVIVEGFFDCMQVHQAGFPCVVGLMGASLSPTQQRLLEERFHRTILFLDGDAAGRRATAAMLPRLARHSRVAVIHLRDGEQPDRLCPKQLKQLIEPVKQQLEDVVRR